MAEGASERLRTRLGAFAERRLAFHVTARLGLAAILVSAAIIRAVGFDSLGYNSDEAVYAGQAAAIVQDPVLSSLFPVFRAHPLLMQALLGAAFAVAGVSESAGRLMSIGWGVATVALVAWVGRGLYGRWVGLLAALFLALMPYHIVVSRQLLLDGPMTFFATLTLGLLAGYGASGRSSWLVAAGAALGLTFLSKETAIVYVAAIFAFLALSPEVPVRLATLGRSVVAFAVVGSAFPLGLLLAGGPTGTAAQYVLWQFFRPPNHDLLFYVSAVPPVAGPLVLVAAVLGAALARRRWSWREKLLVIWAGVPVAFFELWPTKGFQYLLPVAPVVAILAARFFVELGRESRRKNRWLGSFRWAGALVVVFSLLIPSVALVTGAASATGLAGAGGVPGGRETGLWVRGNVAHDERLMTIGPSMANILQFYGHRAAQALAVSPNPLRRNPAYVPIRNPDLAIREGSFRYLVWDAYSAERSPHFAGRLLAYVRRFDGHLVAEVPSAKHSVIRIYAVSGSPGPGRSEPAPVVPPSRPAVIVVVYGAALTVGLLLAIRAVVAGGDVEALGGGFMLLASRRRATTREP